MRTVTLDARQQRQAEILTRLAAGALQATAAAELLGVSERHVRRLRARFAREGMPTVVHGLRGRPPVNRTDPAVVARVVALAGPGGPYAGFNACHLRDLLAEREDIHLGRSTLDRLLRQHHLRPPRRPQRREHRRRRARSRAAGMLLQVDASPHDWLEGRGPRLALLAAVDDACGTLLHAEFRPSEDQAGYLLMFREIALRHGLPMAVYHDRHTILRSPKEPTLEDELAGRPPMSQVQRLLAELGIESIAARSPQAKGRIERLWRTLQDRLLRELRLAGVATPEAANALLPGFVARFNARFGQQPADPDSAWVPIGAALDLDYHFAARHPRTVRRDHTIAWAGRAYQICPTAADRPLVGRAINVHALPQGGLRLYDGARPLTFHPVAASPAEISRPPPPSKKPPPVPAPRPKATDRQRAWLFAATTRTRAPAHAGAGHFP